MDPDSAAAWREEALDHIFAALAASDTITASLVFKGARVLNARLHDEDRQSLDLDANLTATFLDAYPEREQQLRALQETVDLALRNYFPLQDPVRYEVAQVRVKSKPTSGHPWGWDAFEVNIGLQDHQQSSVLGIPRLTIDVAAPEVLGVNAVSPLQVDGHLVTAYTTPRIAGEKLRAFLTSLPTYRTKLKGRHDIVRVKDLFDLVRISRQTPVADTRFWRVAAQEFRIACASRFVDCDGLASFSEQLEVTHATYARDKSIAAISFDDAWSNLVLIVGLFEQLAVVPFEFSLPVNA
jgi:hypothetical protein